MAIKLTPTGCLPRPFPLAQGRATHPCGTHRRCHPVVPARHWVRRLAKHSMPATRALDLACERWPFGRWARSGSIKTDQAQLDERLSSRRDDVLDRGRVQPGFASAPSWSTRKRTMRVKAATMLGTAPRSGRAREDAVDSTPSRGCSS